MILQPRIEAIESIKLVGLSCEMSLTKNTTEALFSAFMTQRKQIAKNRNAPIYEVLVYGAEYFSNFNPNNTFTKWATIKSPDCTTIPEKFTSLQLPDGLYAVFTFKGLVTAFPNYMEYIFTEWLPHSIYDVSKRPHFNILNEMFKKNDTQTEETIWIPIQLKGNPN